jgi:hypothetical protein
MILSGEIKTNKHLWLSKECSFALFGKYKKTSDTTIDVTKCIDEFTFYCLYLTIANLTLEDKLPESQILVAALLMTKSSEFTLSFDGKGTRVVEIAEELKNLSKNTIGLAIKKLKEKGFLVENEDKMLVLSAKLQNVRGVIKTQIKEKGYAEFDYVFKSFIQ